MVRECNAARIGLLLFISVAREIVAKIRLQKRVLPFVLLYSFFGGVSNYFAPAFEITQTIFFNLKPLFDNKQVFTKWNVKLFRCL